MMEALNTQLELLPNYLSHHLQLSLLALAIGVAISIPLAVAAHRYARLEGPVMAAAGFIQTIPSLALLALMVPLLSRIGFLPALIALILYSFLPVLRNTVTGLREVDPNVVEAARGIGMTPNQILTRVELPLALPIIVAGIRTGAVWVVSIATLATPVGATSLGNYIFQGLQLQNYYAVVVGSVSAGALAIFLDWAIHRVEYAVTQSNPRAAWAGAVSMAVLVVISLYPIAVRTFDGETARVRIGSKSFNESYVLARYVSHALGSQGLATERVQSLGSTVVFDALAAGEIDCYVDYSGTIWANHMHRSDNPGALAMLNGVTQWLKSEHGIVCLGPLGFENKYAFAMRQADADRLKVETLHDLARVGAELAFATDYEFLGRPEWTAVRDAYGLRFKEERSLDPALMYPAIAENQVDVITAYSTDGRIIAYDLALIEDPEQALPPYDAILLLSPRAAANPRIVHALTPLVNSIDDKLMRHANKLVDVDKNSLDQAAEFLHENRRP